jgi:hypothetical protein
MIRLLELTAGQLRHRLSKTEESELLRLKHELFPQQHEQRK